MQYTNPYYTDTTEDKSFSGFAGERLKEGEGALSGFSSGGLYGAAIGAAAGQFTNGMSRVKKDKELIDQLNNTNVGNVQYDENGRPILNQNVASSTLSNIDTNSIGRIKGVFNRLNAGGLWGAIPFIGGKKRRHAAERARESARRRLADLQNNFNESNLRYQQQQQQLQQQAKSSYDRQNRIYNIPQQYSTFL